MERLNGEQIGYIERYLAAQIVDHLDTVGGCARGYVESLLGGGYDDYSLGVDIKFMVPILEHIGGCHEYKTIT